MGVVLKPAQAVHVEDQLFGGLLEAEHHGRGGFHAEGMGFAHDGEPLVGGVLEGGDAGADLVVEDLCAAAGEGVHAGGAQADQDLADREVLELGDVDDLGGGEGVEGELEVLLGPAEQVLVVGEAEGGVEAALQEDLDAAEGLGLAELLGQGLAAEDVAVSGAGRGVKVAELAASYTHIGVVDVAVDDVGDDAVGVEGLAALIGGGAECVEVGVLVEEDPLGEIEAAAGRGAGEELVDLHGRARQARGQPGDLQGLGGAAAGEADVDRVAVGEAGDLDQAGVAEAGEELDQALALLGAEAVADRAPEVVGVGVLREDGGVPGEQAGLAVGAGEVLGVLEAVLAGLLQGGDVGGAEEAGAGGPEGEHEGEAGGGLPEVAEVVDVGAREPEGGVADDEGGLGAVDAGEPLAVGGRDELGVDAAGGEQELDEQGGGARGAVEVDAGDLLEGDLGDEDDGEDGAAAADADLGHDLPLGVGRVSADGDEGHVALAGLEAAGALGGQGGGDLEEGEAVLVEELGGAWQVLAGQRVHERPGVEEGDGADSQRHGAAIVEEGGGWCEACDGGVAGAIARSRRRLARSAGAAVLDGDADLGGLACIGVGEVVAAADG